MFYCSNCKASEKKLLKAAQLEAFSGGCKVCGAPLQQTLGKPDTRAMETADEYRDKKVAQNVEEMIEERAKDHHRKHELPRIIEEKGIKYAKEHGFVNEDGVSKI